jgi:hypothetical protein
MKVSLPLFASLVLGLSFSLGWSQTERIDFPAASPTAMIRQQVGLTNFEIVYSRPSVKGREIFGGLQAYGTVWRTGANAATKISFDTAIELAGKKVLPGTYALFSIPEKDTWTIILNREADQWGAFNYDADQDVVRVEVEASHRKAMVETLALEFDDLRDEGANLVIAWENSYVSVPITVDVQTRLVPQIEAVMSSGRPQRDYIYFQAAGFYFDHGLDLRKAAKWIDLALNQTPNAFWMLHLKAKINAKLGNKKEAVEAAKASTKFAVAQEGEESGYKKMNDELLAELK